MTDDELADRVRALLGGSVSCSVSYGTVTADVPRERWVEAASAVRDTLGMVFFDLLTAVDVLEDGFDVVVRLWAPADRHGLLLRTRCPRDDARVASLTSVFAGAAWHERQVWEMFDIDVDGHPGLTPLLLPPGFEGHPMRKEFVLAARVAKAWPGAKDPGESDSDLATGRPRRRLQPPGVPRPGSRP
ncbi:MAG: NADH-quinone oxidoreductase subunit C [Frankiaceae bacterium]|nr:NADH-quinone oxidoreductase subunit C [Frankiaceae bacterium]